MSVYFALISIACIVKLVWLFKVDAKRGWNVSKVVHCLLPGTCVPCTFDYLYYYYNDFGQFYFLNNYKNQSAPQMTMDAPPGYIFISVYVLLCLFWFEVYPTAFMDSRVVQIRLRKQYLIINAVLYSFWITFLIIVWVSPDYRQVAHSLEAWFTISVTTLMAIVFILSGVKLYLRMSKMCVVKAPETLKIGNKIFILTIVFSIVFILRAPLIYLGFFLKFPEDVNYTIHLIFPVVLQGFPTVLVLLLLGKKQYNKEYTRINVTPTNQGYMETGIRHYSQERSIFN